MLDKKFIFIVGVHRSGTLLLYNIIRAQEEISGLKRFSCLGTDEGQHCQDLLTTDANLGGAGNFSFHKDAHLTEDDYDSLNITGVDLFNQWKPYWQHLGVDTFAEKSPVNIVRTRYYQKLFPNSYFILIMRHPIINAFATEKFLKGCKYSKGVCRFTNDHLINHWFKAHEIFFNDKKHLKNVLVVSYEQLIKEPLFVILNIQNFVGVNFNKKIFNVFDGNKKYFKKVKDSHYEYKEKVNKYGYDIKNLNKYPKIKELTYEI